MVDLIEFSAHWAGSRASHDCAESSAKASRVISFRPRSTAKRAKAKQRPAGMPRSRQELTVESAKDSAVATAAVPPRPSMTEPAVSAEVSMSETIVRTVRTCQEFADCETTFIDDYVALGRMIDPPEIIGPRLRAIRLALEYPSQVAFAKALGVEKNTYNPWEKGSRSLTFEAGCVLRRKWGIPLDYLFFGANEDRLPSHIFARLQLLRKQGKAA